MKKLAITLAAFLLIAPAGAFAARTQSSWLYDSSGYIFPTQNPVNVLISGTNLYLNFGTFSGTSGYGFRDNGGIMQFKNSGGSWTAFGSGSGGSSDPFTHLTNYNTSVSATTTPVWFQNGLMASSTSYFADLQTPSLSNLTTNGFVKTSGGNGTLSIDTTSYLSGTVAIANGGTNNSAAIGASSTAVLSDGSKYVYYKLAPANFTTANVSQWTNDAGYITSAATAPIATSSVPTVGNLAYWTGNGYPSTLGSAATSSETCTSPLSCGAHVVLSGGGAITLGTVTIAKGGTGLTAVGASSTVLITDGSAAFWQKLATSQLTNDSGFNSGTVTSVTLATPASTLSLSGTNPVTTSGTINADLNLAHANYWTALQNFTNASSSQLTATSSAYFATVGGVVGIATTSPGSLFSVGGILNATTATTTFYSSGGLEFPASVGNCPITINKTCLTSIITLASAYKAASNYATAAILAGTPTYSNGSSGVGATLTEVGSGALTVDGSSPSAGDRILVKNEASALTNGIYTVTATGSGIASYILTRATDFNNPTDVFPGVATYILAGTANIGDTFVLTTTGTITIGTTALNFAEQAPGGISAGNGISVSGSTVSFDVTKLPVNNLILTYNGSQLQATGTPALTIGYAIATSTTATSTFAGGIQQAGINVYGDYDKSAFISSTTIDTTANSYSLGTSTWNVWNPSRAVTAAKVYCKTDTGTSVVWIGTGAASTTPIKCTSSGVGVTSQSVSFAANANVFLSIGSQSSSNGTTITATFTSN